MDTNTLTRNRWHNKILYADYPADIRGFKVGEWREGHYDIMLDDMGEGAGKQ